MQYVPFSLTERSFIAEFIYGYTQDLLVKNDAISLVEVLSSNRILFNEKSWLRAIENQDEKISTKLINLLEGNVSKDQLTAIMREYYGVPQSVYISKDTGYRQ